MNNYFDNLFHTFNPLQIIKDYFYKYSISLHNKTSFKANELMKKISSLREDVSSYFTNSTFTISFLPNIDLLIKTLINKHKNITIYTNSNDLLSLINDWKKLQLLNISDISEIKTNNEILILFYGLNNDQDLSVFKKIKKNIPNSIIYCSLDHLLYLKDHKFVEYCDYFSFNPMRSLFIYGIEVFGYKEYIEPIYLGSSSLKVIPDLNNLSKSNLIFNQNPNSLEVGTQNYPALLLLEKYFYVLNRNKCEIISQ